MAKINLAFKKRNPEKERRRRKHEWLGMAEVCFGLKQLAWHDGNLFLAG
jgi:hypothetical protein